MARVPFRWKQWAGEEIYAEGESLHRRGSVRDADSHEFCLRYDVLEDQRWRVCFPLNEMPSCTCPDGKENGICRHIVAAGLTAQESGLLEKLYQRKALAAGPALLDAMVSTLPVENTVHLEPDLHLSFQKDKAVPDISLSLRIGEEKLYVVRSIPELLDYVRLKNPMSFGKDFTLHPEWMHFDPAAARLLELLRCLQQASEDQRKSGERARCMPLPPAFAEKLLPILTDYPFVVHSGSQVIRVPRARQARLNLHFHVSGSLQGIEITCQWPQGLVPLTEDCAWLLAGEAVAHVDRLQQQVLQVMLAQQINGVCTFAYPYRDSARVVSELIPFLKLAGIAEIDEELDRMLVRLPLTPRIYIDRDGQEIVARAVFAYGEQEINPFVPAQQPEMLRKGEKLLLRDAAGEHQVLELLSGCGFFVSRGVVRLSNQDAVYAFVTEGIQRLQEACEVYLSEEFRKLSPRRPSLKGSLRMGPEGLLLDFEMDGEPAEEIRGIMAALARKKQYFRLKDGGILDLSGLDEWQELAGRLNETPEVQARRDDPGSAITLQGYRACYLSHLLEELALPVEQDASVRQTVDMLEHPESFEEPVMPRGLGLRPYQLRGYHWLRTLDRLHMGGVLADDMGLGKTVQIIALLKELQSPSETSLVVAPSSLTYNWLNELNRFAPGLSVMVLSGTAAQRQSQIEHVRRAGDIDVLITSYPLLRRDIDQMQDIPFRFAILDEAQQVKNAGSVSAAAVRRLTAQTRFALTGTPMENSSMELWSIFDFVLPGYLGTYTSFMRRYQDGTELEDLRKRIRPFLMRRLKKDVLTELPDKAETVLTAQMTPEQERVYSASMFRLRDRVNRVMDEKGYGRGHMEILSAITELRQICCHPSLVLESYGESSGKLELLGDLLPGLIASGRRILIFSQFTTMLKLLLRRLQATGYACMYLDGDTPPSERVALTERFNGGEAGIFLISLKAGGTGLNLTGADVVILYDPWWNPAAEDQAIDRAHRIGQSRKVDVFRLVTHGTIEEKVVELGRRKKALFDQLITPGEELVTALTEQDIRELFA